MNIMRAFFKREDGATAIEYALIAGLIAIVIVGGVTTIGVNLQPVFTTVGGSVN